MRLSRLFREITHEESQNSLFVGEMVFHLYQHATASNTSFPIDASLQELAARLQDFIKSPAGADKACLVQDSSYALLLLALALLPANTPHYAGILNEMGRYLQGYFVSHTPSDGRFNGSFNNNPSCTGSATGSFTTNECFQTAIHVYQEATLIFEKAGDYVNTSVVLSNFAQLIRQPFVTETLTLGECQTSYQLLHWVNTNLDGVLQSNCNEARKHAVQEGV